MDPNQKGPFDKDVLEDPKDRRLPPLPEQYFPNETPELMEKDFIHEPKQSSSSLLWLWVVLGTMLISLIWGVMAWYEKKVEQQKKLEPFLEVTNREMSVFLWQFPSFIRSNVPKKAGYLPGFLVDRAAVDVTAVDDFVVAPPELLFLYHTWKRLLASDFIVRPITPRDFSEFLAKEEIWNPVNWIGAPLAYKQMVEKKTYESVADLETLSQEEFPLIVRQAFQGWKNYYNDGSKINSFSPTVGEVEAFLIKHPGYARNYWRNIDRVVGQPIGGLKYLELTLQKINDPGAIFPSDQLAAFLKVAMYTALGPKIEPKKSVEPEKPVEEPKKPEEHLKIQTPDSN